MSALQRAIAAKARQEEEDDKRAARWRAAHQAIADGTFKTREIRIPVVLNPDGPVSSPEDLQRITGADSLPEVLETTLTTTDRSKEEEPVRTVTKARICHVNYDEREKLEEKFEVEYMTGKYAVIFRERKRYAMVVKSLKNGGGGNGATGDKGAADDRHGQENQKETS
ncbi:hypothetical protein F5144DRAFT_604603 [Chaetomium tenue]|uniref:Uncharacterized protein n=1 Tax=Chaetomium tenue TaxID=1854479 RepID=A0ACB7P802_9PEZI|nr:hypothetical protein F5144DRAFT_604603 [Chaetomium globosum]